MFDKETLTALQESAAIYQAQNALEGHAKTNNLAALPSDYTLHNMEPYLPKRRRARGNMSTANLDSFVQYIKTHSETGCTVFVNQDNMRASAVLNLGEPSDPGQADNLASLVLTPTAAYKALTAYSNGVAQTQKAIAEFMEDWGGNIKAFDGTGAEIKTAQAVAAVRKITIDAMRKIESTEQALSASKSAFESVQASSSETLPAMLLFVCKPYADLDQRTFALRLGVLTGEAAPKVNLRIVKAEEHQEEMAEELVARISSAFDSGEVLVLLGAYSRGQ